MAQLSLHYELSALPELVEKLRQTFPEQRIFLLEGDLGAGKTTLVAEFCRQIGVADDTSSPTFSIVNEYQCPEGKVFHLDCYRLADIQEALDIGVEDYLDTGRFVFIEWPAVIEPLLPLGVVKVRLSHNSAAVGSQDIRTLTATTPIT